MIAPCCCSNPLRRERSMTNVRCWARWFKNIVKTKPSSVFARPGWSTVSNNWRKAPLVRCSRKAVISPNDSESSHNHTLDPAGSSPLVNWPGAQQPPRPVAEEAKTRRNHWPSYSAGLTIPGSRQPTG